MKTCISCGHSKEDFTGKNQRCDECRARTKAYKSNNQYSHLVEKCREISESIRYKNAVVQKGYRFQGKIPDPKSVDYYKLY